LRYKVKRRFAGSSWLRIREAKDLGAGSKQKAILQGPLDGTNLVVSIESARKEGYATSAASSWQGIRTKIMCYRIVACQATSHKPQATVE
jgi:hypothetical protein